MELSKSTIKALNSQREGRELKVFITSLIESLDRVSDIPKDWSEKKIAIEVCARQQAAEKLAEILKPFIEYIDPAEKEDPETY